MTSTPYLKYQRAAMVYIGRIIRGEIPTDSREELDPIADLYRQWLESDANKPATIPGAELRRAWEELAEREAQ